MEGRSYIFLKSFERVENEFEILWGNVFLGFWGGERERKKGKGIGRFLGYVWGGM